MKFDSRSNANLPSGRRGRGPPALLHGQLSFSYWQTKECLYAALYTPLASKGLPRSYVGTLDCNPTTVGLGPRLGSQHTPRRGENGCVCTCARFAGYIHTIVNRERTKEWPPMTSRRTMTTVTCLATHPTVPRYYRPSPLNDRRRIECARASAPPFHTLSSVHIVQLFPYRLIYPLSHFFFFLFLFQ